MSSYWINLAGPVVGARAAVLITIAFHGAPNTAERRAAAGN